MINPTINIQGLAELQDMLEATITAYEDLCDTSSMDIIELLDPDYEMIETLEAYSDKLESIRRDIEWAAILSNHFNSGGLDRFKPEPDAVKLYLKNNWNYTATDSQAEQISAYYKKYFR